ncbi:hypothetical protein EK904_008628 [Melospiza melodia maxima]|nr:hypothetical protein EK904_008628 [Melospiza melodia maxima]
MPIQSADSTASPSISGTTPFSSFLPCVFMGPKECHHECPLANWIRKSVTAQDNLEDDSAINRECDDSEMTAPGSTFWD